MRAERTSRSHYHPYYSTDSFDKLRHHLPSAISAGCYSNSVTDQPWNYPQPNTVIHYMHSPIYLFNGQDANLHSFPQRIPPYFMTPYETEATFNNEDPDMGSFSGEDDGDERDSNAQLRSQQLNSDGTPKRPMNAFMIFARKRRPMVLVSSEQPTMRTGEISKILSKEWSEMGKEDKQFYLDQAKKLKDTFNTRWPDYVYRRRPNNSRKRRKVGGTSDAGPTRSHDGANNSDGHAEVLVDPSTLSQSSDETRSQSTDTFSSPLSCQHNVLFRTPELSQAGSLDRSPTPAGTLPIYTAPAQTSFAPSGAVDGSAFSGYDQQDRPYGENAETYYESPATMGAHTPATELGAKSHSWHSCEGAPSGIVAAASSTPPVSTPLAVTQGLRSQIAYTPHKPGNWLERGASDVRSYEGQPMIWGSNPSISGHHGVDSPEVTGTLHTPTNLVGSNALGMYPYGNHKDLFDVSPCQPAYIEGNHVHEGYRPVTSLSPFHGQLSAPHHSATYFEPHRWTLGGHDS
ncbi:unnamed protein product [Rhizoctonia solani]|uniref:HMG box domain-containing protein n=1 Tax=Rhizoctonia solani TaxID=456999 RepID=A0A8H3DG53_9AGAM|nr:unnamed protein product [Rhizoctonia solani]